MSHILVTGATGKVGSNFVRRILNEPAHDGTIIRALCHNRQPEPHARVEVVTGSISERAVVRQAMQGVTHVVHCATCKETEDLVMDVTVKGLFWLLEECRRSSTFRQFILIGGDAALGHFFYPHPVPVTEQQKHSCVSRLLRALKGAGRGDAGAVLRAVQPERAAASGLHGSWRRTISNTRSALVRMYLAGPRWRDLVGPEAADAYQRSQTVPVMLDPDGVPVKRNFVHVTDLVEAMLIALDHPKARQQTFNICMDEPVDYRAMANYLNATRGMPSVDVKTPYRSTWLDNTKAKFLLGWRPRVDLPLLIENAWTFQRAESDPRNVWYLG